MTHASVTIQITPQSQPATPSWMGEVAAFAQVLTHTGLLQTIQGQVRFACARFGRYDLLDFAAVLIGSILSGEPTLLAFYDRLAPFAEPFMALFGRNRLPHRSTPISVSGCPRSSQCRGASDALSEGFAYTPTVAFSWRLV
jgi:hypothetical protein